ncbi:phosphoribosylglycinamide formyltransferase [Bacteroidales bacterium]
MCQINIAIFASGSGTNAENLIKHFSNSKYIKVVLVLSNKNDAPVLEKARNLNVPSYTFSAFELNDTRLVDTILDKYKIDSLILAGFLLKVPNRIIERYRDQIINIHPSLLPKYGGKGMYGLKVHKAVIEACERESGITIHLVDEIYDNGKILFQSRCNIIENETPESLALKIHSLEYRYFPEIVEKYLLSFKKRNCDPE